MRLTEILLKQTATSRNQNLKTKKMTNYVKSAYNTRVASTQYLKDSVLETRSKVGTGGMCLGDMQVLLDCMKMNEFQEKSCLQEMTKYRECVGKEKTLQAELNAMRTSDELGTEGRLNPKQVNKLLRMYPNPSPQFYFTHNNKKPLRKPEIIQYNRDDPPQVPENIYRKTSS